MVSLSTAKYNISTNGHVSHQNEVTSTSNRNIPGFKGNYQAENGQTIRNGRQHSELTYERHKCSTDLNRDSLTGNILKLLYSGCAFLLVVCLLPFLLPMSLLFGIYHRTIIFIITHVRKDKVDVVSGADAVWLQDSESNKAIINAILEFRGTPDIEQFRNRFNERLVLGKDGIDGKRLLPKVTQSASTILRRYVWIESNAFNIDDHIFIHDHPAPTSKAELETLVGELCSKPLPDGKAAWQFILLKHETLPEGQSSNDQTYYAVFRVHHSIADGISLVKLLVQRLVDKVPKMILSPRRFSSRASQLHTVLKVIFEGPGILIQRLMWGADRHILHGRHKLYGKKLVSWSERIDLNFIKQMKNVTGTTVNDVLVSCLSGAFRDYLKKYSSSVPKEIKAYIPVDMRPNSQKLTLDNQFSLVFLALPLNEADPVKTLFMVKDRMNKIKVSAEPILTTLVMKYCMARLPNWSTKKTFDWLSDKCSMVLSNVPGPQEKMSIAGQTLTDMLFWPPQRSKMGVGISIYSYDGSVRIGVLVDQAVCTNPNLLVTEFVSKLHELAAQLKLD